MILCAEKLKVGCRNGSLKYYSKGMTRPWVIPISGKTANANLGLVDKNDVREDKDD